MARQAQSGFLVLIAALLGYAASAGAQSPTPAATPCDPQYMDSLEARAWLEAQREITQNQNLIYKPDSVLEYTCFGGHLQELADHATTLLSETNRWGPINGITPISMDTALANLVGSALSSYLETNFERTTAGGTYDLLGGRIPVNGGQGIDYVPPTPIRGGTYNCDVMNRVWMQAKCMDFITTAAEDGFFTFAEYQSGQDKRFLPQRCAAIQQRWQDQINLATVDANTTWTEDNVVAFVNNLKHPTAATGNCDSFPKIETGLIVRRAEPAPTVYFEKICTNPGCRYVPSGGSGTGPSNQGTCVAN